MAWDFQTEPEFQEQLDWMEEFVRSEIWPLETLVHELEWDALMRAMEPLQEQVRERGLWAAHLDAELGGQGFGQVKLGLMHEILGTSPIASSGSSAANASGAASTAKPNPVAACSAAPANTATAVATSSGVIPPP